MLSRQALPVRIIKLKEYVMKQLFFIMIFTSLVSCASWSPTKHLAVVAKPANTNQLTARYFGASTILFSDGKTSILIDGFFTRPQLFSKVKSTQKSIDAYLLKNNIKQVDLMLLSHAHYDHILDSGYVANAKNASVYGAKASIDIVGKQMKNPNKAHIVKDRHRIRAGDFSITFYETPHVKKTTLINFFESTRTLFAGGSKYKKSGKNFSFLIEYSKTKILVIPSSGDSNGMLPDVEADIVFLSTGLLKEKNLHNYWHETVISTGAKSIIPIHWDDLNLFGTGKLILKPAPGTKKIIKFMTKLSKKDPERIIPIKWPPGFVTFNLDQSLYSSGPIKTQLE